MGFEAVALDEKIPSPYLDRYEPTKGKKDYMFICSSKKWRTEIHYSDVLKTSFHCFDGSCCQVIPQKTAYTIYLVAQYVEGRNAKSGLVLKFLRAGRQLDDSIRAIAEQFDDPAKLTRIDLKVELDTSKPEKYKSPKITPCIDGKRMAGKEALIDLKEQINTYMPNLQQSIATVMTEEQFATLCKEHDIDIDEVSETPLSTKTKKAPTPKAEEDVIEETEDEVEETEDEVEETSEASTLDVEEIPFDDEPEEAPKTKSSTKKLSKDEIESQQFDLDDLSALGL